jgi:hypothetical protein
MNYTCRVLSTFIRLSGGFSAALWPSDVEEQRFFTTNSMQQIPFREANSHSASQEIHRLL